MNLFFIDSDPFAKDGFISSEAINVGNGGHHAINIEQQNEFYHIAVDGYTFGVIKDHYQQLFKRVCF